MNRRHLLKAAGAIAVAGMATALPQQTASAHKKEALREVHLKSAKPAPSGSSRW
jgi:anaerobic selenocysteine-containing dehydrogenase